MKILVQPAFRDVVDWVELESSQWQSTPKRDVPVTGQLGGVDNRPGYISEVNIQGAL